MAAYWQVIAGVLLTVVVGLTLSKQGKDTATLLSLAVCAMVMLTSRVFLEPVISFLRSLQEKGYLDGEVLTTMLKAVGISLVSQISCFICEDGGFGSLSKAVRLMTAAALLYLMLPMLESLLSLLESVAGGL